MNSESRIKQLLNQEECLKALEETFTAINKFLIKNDKGEMVVREDLVLREKYELIRLFFIEKELKATIEDKIMNYPDVIGRYNKASKTRFFDMIDKVFLSRDISLYDQIFECTIEEFMNTYDNADDVNVLVGTCYENGRFFEFFFDNEGLNIYVLDFLYERQFATSIKFSDFEIGLLVFNKFLDAYYTARYMKTQSTKVNRMIKSLYEKYPILALR